MIRLERWITRVITERPDPDQQQLRTAPPSGTSCGGCVAEPATPTPPTAKSSPPDGTSRPASFCSSGSPPTG
jgi:hypothetical protein